MDYSATPTSMVGPRSTAATAAISPCSRFYLCAVIQRGAANQCATDHDFGPLFKADEKTSPIYQFFLVARNLFVMPFFSIFIHFRPPFF
jgi:hypothetical protein